MNVKLQEIYYCIWNYTMSLKNPRLAGKHITEAAKHVTIIDGGKSNQFRFCVFC